MRTIISMFLLCGIATVGFAGQTDWQQFMLESRSPALSMAQEQQKESVADPASSVPGKKSPKVGLLISAAVPGAGQAYAGKYWRAAAFIAIEAVGWYVWATQTKKGRDIEQEFQEYADTHWSEDDYWDYIAYHSGIDRNDIEALREWEQSSFSHHLHREKDQQYYEMIGKYHQFNYGWDDFDKSLISVSHYDMVKQNMASPHRLYYEDRRYASNKAYEWGRTGITVVLLNHILSSLEAAWTIHRQNQKLQASLHGDYLRSNTRTVPALTLQLDW